MTCITFCFAITFLLCSYKSYSKACPKTIINTAEGNIAVTGDNLCRSWEIHVPDNSITTLRLNHFIVNNCNNVYFDIHDSEMKYNSCYKDDKPKLLPTFRKSPIHITISTGNKVTLVLEFTSRNFTICPDKDYQCKDKSNCFNFNQICDGKFNCNDHSDEICEFCPEHSVPCSIKSSKCFNPKLQRCDSHYDCPSAEDEFNCTTGCANGIKCQNSTRCFQPHQRCNGINDCIDGSDEKHCPTQYCDQGQFFSCDDGGCIGKELVNDGRDDCKDGSDEKNKHKAIQIILLLTLIVLSCLTTVLVHRWCNSRRNVNQLIRNPPEFPLPPFRGPGEYVGYQLQFSECDYLHGGEIYESFIESRTEGRHRRTILHRRRRMDNYVHNVTPRSGIIAPNNATVTALVSLGISPEFCIGLENTMKEVERESRESTEETDSLRYTSPNFDRNTNRDVRVINEVEEVV